MHKVHVHSFYFGKATHFIATVMVEIFHMCSAYHGHLASLRVLNSNNPTVPNDTSVYDVTKVGVSADWPIDAQNHASSLRQALLPADHAHGHHTNAVREVVKQQELKGKKVPPCLEWDGEEGDGKNGDWGGGYCAYCISLTVNVSA